MKDKAKKVSVAFRDGVYVMNEGDGARQTQTETFYGDVSAKDLAKEKGRREISETPEMKPTAESRKTVPHALPRNPKQGERLNVKSDVPKRSKGASVRTRSNVNMSLVKSEGAGVRNHRGHFRIASNKRRVLLCWLTVAAVSILLVGPALIVGAASWAELWSSTFNVSVIVAAVLGLIFWIWLVGRFLYPVIDIVCSNTDCNGHIKSNSDWVCGTCKTVNHWSFGFPDSFLNASFLKRCGNCNATPQALYCRHCEFPVFLEGKELCKPYAYLAGQPDPNPSGEELQKKLEANKRAQRQERTAALVDIELDTKVTKALDERLKVEMEFQDTQEVAKERARSKSMTARERLEADLIKTQEKHLLVRRIAEEFKRNGAVEYANDPEMKETNEIAIDNWVHDNLP